MVNIVGLKSDLNSLDEYINNEDIPINEEYLIYTGNNNKSKYIFYVVSIDSNSITVKNATRSDNRDSNWVNKIDPVNKVPFIPVIDLTKKELKEILIPAAYDKLKQSDTFKLCKSNKQQVKQQEKPKMKIENKIMQNNTKAAKAAAQLAAGNVLNKTIAAKVKPQLPMFVKGYADHPLANVVIANIAAFAVQNFAADNAKAVWASNSMMIAAMAEFMQSFNLEKIVDEVLSSVTIPDEVGE